MQINEWNIISLYRYRKVEELFDYTMSTHYEYTGTSFQLTKFVAFGGMHGVDHFLAFQYIHASIFEIIRIVMWSINR